MSPGNSTRTVRWNRTMIGRRCRAVSPVHRLPRPSTPCKPCFAPGWGVCSLRPRGCTAFPLRPARPGSPRPCCPKAIACFQESNARGNWESNLGSFRSNRGSGRACGSTKSVPTPSAGVGEGAPLLSPGGGIPSGSHDRVSHLASEWQLMERNRAVKYTLNGSEGPQPVRSSGAWWATGAGGGASWWASGVAKSVTGRTALPGSGRSAPRTWRPST